MPRRLNQEIAALARPRRLRRRRLAAGAERRRLTMQRIPATIITGFLVAGKTSLVRHLLANANGTGSRSSSTNSANSASTARCCLAAATKPVPRTISSNWRMAASAARRRRFPADLDTPHRARRATRPYRDRDFRACPAEAVVQAFAWPEIRTRTTVDGVLTVIDAAALAAGLFASDPEAVARQREADPSIDHDTRSKRSSPTNSPAPI